MLESFGTLRVLSSPKYRYSTASLLKVVNNEVYFTITVTRHGSHRHLTRDRADLQLDDEHHPRSDCLMTVTPQISENGEVILNLRPTISRISGYAMGRDPVYGRKQALQSHPHRADA